MSKISQRQAVETATRNHFGERFEEGLDVKSYATKQDQKEIAAVVAQGMLDGEVELSQEAFAKYAQDGIDHLVSKYVMGMVKNWFNKSLTLNGGAPYQAKNPGSRTNHTLKNLKLLLANTTDPADRERIEVEIAKEQAQSKATKSTKASVDPDMIPDSLKDLIESAS